MKHAGAFHWEAIHIECPYCTCVFDGTDDEGFRAQYLDTPICAPKKNILMQCHDCEAMFLMDVAQGR